MNTASLFQRLVQTQHRRGVLRDAAEDARFRSTRVICAVTSDADAAYGHRAVMTARRETVRVVVGEAQPADGARVQG